MQTSGVITVLTDFGLHDVYVGVMKGVILSIFPQARMVDLTHEIGPQDVEAAAWALLDAALFFPRGTVHLAVVDPGVGTERRAIAVFSRGHYFVGPDNGVFSGFYPAESIVELTRPETFLPEVSATFHGRDIFAPVAARLASGMKPPELGEPVTDPVTVNMPRPVEEDGVIIGEVVQVDRFGNLVTNVPASMVTEGAKPIIEICDRKIEGMSVCYSAAVPGQAIALTGSCGRIEIACPGGSAAKVLGGRRGDRVEINLDRKGA